MIRVLLVEDNSSDAFLVETLLEEGVRMEYRTHRVKSQAEAVSALTQQAFDVCLLDLTLPDASGFSALIDIQEKAPLMPVLILTGINDTALAKRAVGRGAQDYLLKDEMEINGLVRAIDYAMERKRLEKELFQRANYDALTGLASRDMFLSRLSMMLARAERSGSRIAVLFIDLDRFKPINDVHGHDAGDEALKLVAQRIKASLRAYDTPARFGGDEFAVLLEGIDSPRDAAVIAQKIIKALSQPMPYHAHQLEISTSIGIAFSGAHASASLLLQQSDIAMYHAKKEGGGACQFYAESMHDEALARISMEEDLRTALEAGELKLYYQPCVAPDGGAVLGVEVLLRWAHPERGLLCAHEFLPAAEEARLMPQIAQWMCSQLRHDIAMINAHALPSLGIAVNLSVSQLDVPDLAQWLSPLAQADFLGDHRLAVEICEDAIAPISGSRFMALAKLHEMGIGLHLDHFGCSALPLTTLCSLPFSLLKLDRSLIGGIGQKPADNVLVSAAIMLAHHLGMKAGAVGVETPGQALALKAQACDVMQGFFTVEPMTIEQLMLWLAKK
jgi:diguanylate cyclase (GGDEF)-like protein